MYIMHENIRYSEIDGERKITLPSIINYFQDCSTRQSESLGMGLKAVEKKQKGWVLSSWQVIVKRYADFGEDVEVATCPTAFKGIYGTRNFLMRDQEAKILAYANSIWVYMDFEKGRAMRIPQEEIDAYPLEPAFDMEYTSRKIVIPQKADKELEFKVCQYHIDTNHHVNNCQYVQMAMEFIGEFQVRQLRVEYKKAATYGVTIVPYIAKENERLVVMLSDTNGQPYAVVEFIGENKCN